MSAAPWPALIAHADWSAHPAGRCLALARRDATDGYRIGLPEPVADAGGLLGRLAAAGPTLIGFDFPIGLPRHYAAARGIARFPEFLRDASPADWTSLLARAAPPALPTLASPFYPARPGGATRSAFDTGLGLSYGQLLRRCDRPAGASMLFWTLGAKQCGRAALAGWDELLRPALRRGDGLGLWPFDGDLAALTATCAVTVAETYPGLCGRRLFGAQRPWSKQRPDDRARLGAELLVLMPGLGAQPDAALREGLATGLASDHAFDALVGLTGLLAVARGRWPASVPDDQAVRTTEGWLIGLDA